MSLIPVKFCVAFPDLTNSNRVEERAGEADDEAIDDIPKKKEGASGSDEDYVDPADLLISLNIRTRIGGEQTKAIWTRIFAAPPTERTVSARYRFAIYSHSQLYK